MKVILLIDNLNSGGAQRQLVMLSNYIYLQKKCYVEILTYYPGNHFQELTSDLGIKTKMIRKKNKYDITLVFRIARYINENKFDVLCAFLFTPSLYGLLVKIFSFRKLGLVVSERSFERELNLVARLTRSLYNYSDFITANSYSQTNNLISRYPKLSAKILFVKNGVDIKINAPQKNRIPRDLSIAGIGRVEKLKNIHCLIEALNILKNKYKLNLVVRWAGSIGNTQEDICYFNSCNKILNDYGLIDSWYWLGVIKEIPALINSTEILVHPSLGEGFPNTICEGMSCGSVVFASEILDHPFIIKDGINGFLFNPNNPSELALKIFAYSSLAGRDKDLIRSNARKSAESDFSFSQMGESYYKLFVSCL